MCLALFGCFQTSTNTVLAPGVSYSLHKQLGLFSAVCSGADWLAMGWPAMASSHILQPIGACQITPTQPLPHHHVHPTTPIQLLTPQLRPTNCTLPITHTQLHAPDYSHPDTHTQIHTPNYLHPSTHPFARGLPMLSIGRQGLLPPPDMRI